MRLADRIVRSDFSRRHSLVVACSYLILGLAWIAISDYFMAAASPELVPYRRVRVTEGAAFVFVSAFLLFAVLARVERSLRRRNYLLDGLLLSSPAAIIAVDFEGRVLLWNARAELLFGWRADEVLGKRPPNLPPGSQHELDNVLQRNLRGESIHGVELQRLRRDGQTISVSFANAPLRGSDGRPIGAIGMFSDLRPQKEAERLVVLQAAALQAAASAVIVTDRDGDIVSVNPAFTRLTGYSSEEVQGRSHRILSSRRHDPACAELAESIRAGKEYRGRLLNRRKNGTLYMADVAVAPVFDAVGKILNFVGIHEDVTEATRLVAQVEFLTSYDSLTQLPNRALFLRRSKDFLVSARAEGVKFAVIAAEVANLRQVAQSLGREAAEDLVREVSQRLNRAAGLGAEVSSLGSGGFAVLWPTTAPEADLPILLAQWREVCEMQLALREVVVHPRMIFGCAMFPDHGAELHRVLDRAEAALAVAIERRQPFQMFQDHLRSSLDELALEADLRQAIPGGELFVAYQPIYDLRSSELQHVEALVRWNHPRHGVLLPDRFLGVAESSGLMPQIDLWVLRRVSQQLRSSQDHHRFQRMAVNVTGDTLAQPDLISRIEGLVASREIAPEKLILEVTETNAMRDRDRSTQALTVLRSLGFKVALDDFGVAYSSLNYLRQLPVDILKIDRSFIRGLGTMSQDERVVRTILALALDYGFEVVAEGIEEPVQLEWLRNHDCDYGQGYLLGRPGRLDELLKPTTVESPRLLARRSGDPR